MATTIGELLLKISADSAKLRSELDKAAGELKGFVKEISESLEQIKELMFFEAIGEGIEKLGEWLSETAKTSQELNNMSMILGVSIEEMTRWGYAARQVGMSQEQLALSFERLARNMEFALTGEGKQKMAFEALGIELEGHNGKMRESIDVMMDIADAFSGMKDGAGKTALAVMMMGREGAELIPLLNQGSEGIKAWKEESDKMARTLGTDSAEAAVRFNQSLNKLRGGMEILGVSVLDKLEPAFTKWINTMDVGGRQITAFTITSEALSFAIKLLAGAALVLESGMERLSIRAIGLYQTIEALASADWSGASKAVIRTNQELEKEAQRYVDVMNMLGFGKHTLYSSKPIDVEIEVNDKGIRQLQGEIAATQDQIKALEKMQVDPNGTLFDSPSLDELRKKLPGMIAELDAAVHSGIPQVELDRKIDQVQRRLDFAREQMRKGALDSIAAVRDIVSGENLPQPALIPENWASEVETLTRDLKILNDERAKLGNKDLLKDSLLRDQLAGGYGRAFMQSLKKDAPDLENNKEEESAIKALEARIMSLREKAGTLGMDESQTIRWSVDFGQLHELLEKAGDSADKLRERLIAAGDAYAKAKAEKKIQDDGADGFKKLTEEVERSKTALAKHGDQSHLSAMDTRLATGDLSKFIENMRKASLPTEELTQALRRLAYEQDSLALGEKGQKAADSLAEAYIKLGEKTAELAFETERERTIWSLTNGELKRYIDTAAKAGMETRGLTQSLIEQAAVYDKQKQSYDTIKAAKSAWEEAKSPAVKYRESLELLNDPLVKAKLTQEQLNAALGKAREDFEKAGGEMSKFTQTMAANMRTSFADALTATPDTSKLEQAYTQYAQAMSRIPTTVSEDMRRQIAETDPVIRKASSDLNRAIAENHKNLFERFEDGLGNMAQSWAKTLQRMVTEALAADLLGALGLGPDGGKATSAMNALGDFIGVGGTKGGGVSKKGDVGGSPGNLVGGAGGGLIGVGWDKVKSWFGGDEPNYMLPEVPTPLVPTPFTPEGLANSQEAPFEWGAPDFTPPELVIPGTTLPDVLPSFAPAVLPGVPGIPGLSDKAAFPSAMNVGEGPVPPPLALAQTVSTQSLAASQMTAAKMESPAATFAAIRAQTLEVGKISGGGLDGAGRTGGGEAFDLGRLPDVSGFTLGGDIPGLDEIVPGSDGLGMTAGSDYDFGDLGADLDLGFAKGGRPPLNKASWVGEEGPEIFVPDSLGTVIPNDEVGGFFANEEKPYSIGAEQPNYQVSAKAANPSVSNDSLVEALSGLTAQRPSGPMQVQLHPDAMNMTLRDWLEAELARAASTRGS